MEKRINVPITGKSPYSPSLAKYLPDFCSTDSYQTSRKKSIARASAVRELPVAQQTCCLFSVISWKSAQNKKWTICYYSRPHKSLNLSEQDRTMAYPQATWPFPNVLQMVIQLYENQCGLTRLNGDLSEPITITNGVERNYVQIPTQFSISFSILPEEATNDLEDEDRVHVSYCMDGRLQTHYKTQERLIRDLPFTDDAALVAHTEQA